MTLCDKGGGGFQTLPKIDDIIFEQLLNITHCQLIFDRQRESQSFFLKSVNFHTNPFDLVEYLVEPKIKLNKSPRKLIKKKKCVWRFGELPSLHLKPEMYI